MPASTESASHHLPSRYWQICAAAHSILISSLHGSRRCILATIRPQLGLQHQTSWSTLTFSTSLTCRDCLCHRIVRTHLWRLMGRYRAQCLMGSRLTSSTLRITWWMPVLTGLSRARHELSTMASTSFSWSCSRHFDTLVNRRQVDIFDSVHALLLDTPVRPYEHCRILWDGGLVAGRQNVCYLHLDHDDTREAAHKNLKMRHQHRSICQAAPFSSRCCLMVESR
jgi:hypothetical protein